jgi:hypothetical protein
MELFAATGDTVLAVDGVKNGGPYGLLATGTPEEGGLELVAYRFDEQDPYEGAVREVTVTVEGLSGRALCFDCHRMDKDTTAYAEWVRQGRPKTPDKADMAALRAAAEPAPEPITVPIEGGRATLTLPLAPSTLLVLLGKVLP